MSFHLPRWEGLHTTVSRIALLLIGVAAPLPAPPGAVPELNVTCASQVIATLSHCASMASVKLRVLAAGRKIPDRFLGLSYEPPVLKYSDWNVRNQIYQNVLTNLGSGSLRFGGASVDYTGWSRTRARRRNGERAVLNPTDLDRLFAFSARVQWPVILGLNSRDNDPSEDADEAAYAIGRSKRELCAFEIGNEPDLYTTGLKLPTGSSQYDTYRRRFESYAEAIRSRVPGAPFAGPATARTSGPPSFLWYPRFLKDEAGLLNLATQHIYPMISQPNLPVAGELMDTTSPIFPSVTNMLSKALMQRVGHQVDELVIAARKDNIPLRIDETNSAARGGEPGVSDVLAAALWGADYAFTLAEHGAAGLNFHGGFACTGYTPICRSGSIYVARPLYYGMLLFHLAMPGRAVPLSIVSEANLSAHAVLGARKQLALVLINKEPSTTVTVVLSGANGYHRATLIRLMGNSLDSGADITIGGEAVRADGTWKPIFTEPVSRHGGTFLLTLPPASALLAKFN